MTTRPHLKYRGIRDEAKAAATDLFAQRPWTLENGEKVDAAQAFADELSSIYGVPSPQIQISPRIFHSYSYRPAIRTALDEQITRGVITLKNWSILQLFKALREHINYCKNQRVDEFDWACSLFYSVKPTMFRKRVREGRINGVAVAALYTTETWERMKAEGLVDEYDRLVVPQEETEDEDELAALAMDLAVEGEVLSGIDETEAFLSEQAMQAEADAADQRADAAFGVNWDEDDEDEDESDDDDEPTVAEQVAAETDEAFRNDGLDNLGIVALRRLGSGQSIPGMWNLDKPGLIAALRAKGIRA